MGSGNSTISEASLSESSRELAQDPLYTDSLDKIAAAFDEFDQDSNGYIGKAEFVALCQRYLASATTGGTSRFNEQEIYNWFESLDLNRDGYIDQEEFLMWWKGSPEGSSDGGAIRRRSSSLNRFDAVRKRISDDKGIFLGFTFADWKRAKALDRAAAFTWTPSQVLLFLATDPALSVLRNELDRDAWSDIDGETLLGMDKDDFVAKGIKSYHITKLTRVLDSLKSDISSVEIQDLNQHRKLQIQTSSSSVATSEGAASPSKALRRRASNLAAEATTERSNLQESPRRRRTQDTGQSSNGSVPSAPENAGFDWTKSDLLGQGAFGKVYLGLDNVSGAFLAVKEITFTRENTKELEELKTEIRLLRQLEHMHIVRYLGAEVPAEAVDGGLTLHIFTEYMPGGSVLHVIKKFGALAEPVVRNYTRQMLRGLSYLHEKGIVHRDIKPANVLVDERGLVKLADFGASKQIALAPSGKTIELENQTLKGTPYFMAPEVMTQTGHGRKSDIWSIGATVMQMRTGSPPWKSKKFESLVQLMCHIAQNEDAVPEVPSDPSLISKSLHSFITVCFQRSANDRPSAVELSAHAFLKENEDLDLGKEENMDSGDTMADTIAMIEHSAAKKYTTDVGSVDESYVVDGNSSIMSDLSLSMSVIPQEEDLNPNPDGNQNPFSSNGEYASGNVTGTEIAAKSPKASDIRPPTNATRGEAAKAPPNGKSKSAQDNPEEGADSEEDESKKYRVGSKKWRKQQEKKKRLQQANKEGVEDTQEGVQTINGMETNSWKQREERPIESRFHKKNLELTAKRAEMEEALRQEAAAANAYIGSE